MPTRETVVVSHEILRPDVPCEVLERIPLADPGPLSSLPRMREPPLQRADDLLVGIARFQLNDERAEVVAAVQRDVADDQAAGHGGLREFLVRVAKPRGVHQADLGVLEHPGIRSGLLF